MHLYESHMGGIYTEENLLDWEDLYCEECGDSDKYIGEANTFEEAWNLVKDDCSYKGSEGYSLQYIFPELCSSFDVNEDYQNKDRLATLSDDEILQRIAIITGKTVTVYAWYIRIDRPCGEIGYTDYIITDNEEAAVAKFHIDKSNWPADRKLEPAAVFF